MAKGEQAPTGDFPPYPGWPYFYNYDSPPPPWRPSYVPVSSPPQIDVNAELLRTYRAYHQLVRDLERANKGIDWKNPKLDVSTALMNAATVARGF